MKVETPFGEAEFEIKGLCTNSMLVVEYGFILPEPLDDGEPLRAWAEKLADPVLEDFPKKTRIEIGSGQTNTNCIISVRAFLNKPILTDNGDCEDWAECCHMFVDLIKMGCFMK